MPTTRRQLGAAIAAAALGGGSMALAPRAEAAAPTWSFVDAEQRAISARFSSFAATVTPAGRFAIVHSVNPNVLMPLASSIKLYVMLAVVDAVRSGRYTWSTQFTLAAADKAVGSGTLASKPVGTRVSLQTAATHVMHLSDNTAASMLIRYLGQPAMRRAVVASGHARPEALNPFLTLRQDLWLNWSPDARAVTARRSWAAASATRRTELIAPATWPGARPADFSTARPGWPRGLGYFATAQNLARAHVLLHLAAREPRFGPLRAILANPTYLITKPAGWKYQQFKGGTAPGVKVGSWYAETAGADQVLVMMQASTGSVNLPRFNATATVAAGILSRTR